MGTLRMQVVISWLLCLLAASASPMAQPIKGVASAAKGLLISVILCRGLAAGVRLCSYVSIPAFILGLITAVFLRESLPDQGWTLPLITALSHAVIGCLLYGGYISHPLFLMPLFMAESVLLSPKHILPLLIPLCLPLPLPAKLCGVLIALTAGGMLQTCMDHTEDLHPRQYIIGITAGVLISFIN